MNNFQNEDVLYGIELKLNLWNFKDHIKINLKLFLFLYVM